MKLLDQCRDKFRLLRHALHTQRGHLAWIGRTSRPRHRAIPVGRG